MKRINKFQRAGSLGGRATLKKYGPGHFARIGKRGAEIMHSRYGIEPFGLNNYALIHRGTGEIKAFLGSRPGQPERDLPYD